jgi:hypothetical protein
MACVQANRRWLSTLFHKFGHASQRTRMITMRRHGSGKACPARRGRSKRRPDVCVGTLRRCVHVPDSVTVFMKCSTKSTILFTKRASPQSLSEPDLAPEFSRRRSRFAPGVFSENPIEKRAGFRSSIVPQIHFPVCQHEFGDEFFRRQEAHRAMMLSTVLIQRNDRGRILDHPSGRP